MQATGFGVVGRYVPERIVTNDELALTVDTSDEWIFSHTGIRERRIAAPGEAASDLGTRAANDVLSRQGLTASDIDLVITASSSPDHPFPSTACLIQAQIGAERAGAFDLQAGCSGFIYGLESARAFVAAGSAERVLLVATEVLTSITNWDDRNTCILFGDGAAAVVVTRAEVEGSTDSHIIETSLLASRGEDGDALIRRVGGSREPYDPATHTAADTMIAMDGRRVYLFAVDAIVRTIRELCERSGLAVDELDWIVPHQANQRIVDAAAKRLKLPLDRFFTNLDRYANTSAASIPLALHEMEERDLLKNGMKIATVGFGAGLTYGGNIITW